jgi:hypothetical protein
MKANKSYIQGDPMTRLCFILITLVLASPSYAIDIAAVLSSKGRVELLIPSKKAGLGKVMFEGSIYKLKKLRRGQKVKFGQVVKTGSDGSAKLVFPNGDQLAIGPGSIFQYDQKRTKNNGKSEQIIKLLYGQLRATVSKKGPRANSKVISPTAVAGVRGTDFFISQNPSKGFDVSVLRGKVAVSKPKKAIKNMLKEDLKIEKIEVSKPVDVNVGMTAKIKAAPEPKDMAKSEVTNEPEIIEVEQTSKEELIKVAVVSKSVALTKEEKKELPPELKKLEKVAVKSVIEDIVSYDPEAAKTLDPESLSIDEINKTVVVKAVKAAPAAPPKRKLTEDEINALGEDLYKDYFQ